MVKVLTLKKAWITCKRSFNFLSRFQHGKSKTYPALWQVVKKATGLGITEFMLRLMAWLCLKDDNYRNSQMVIVTGPNIDISVKLIQRMKQLFDPISFDSKETMIELNGVTIEAYPSSHLDAHRALDKPKFILLDEADFFRKGEQQDVRNVSERYIAKSDPFIVMISTPNAPGGLFEAIEKESEDACIYKRVKLDYTYGLDRIYTRQEIEKAKTSPSFEREYNLKYLGRIGNVFHIKDIEKAMSVPYDPEYVNPMAVKSIGIDPAWGSSAFGIVVTQFVDGKVQVLYAEEFERPDYNEILDKTWELICKYDPTKIWIDGANPSFIRSPKINISGNEEIEYEQAISRYKQMKVDYGQNKKVIPVNFSSEHKAMLGNTKMLLEDELIAIDSSFDKLI
jgi:hypothetical protein